MIIQELEEELTQIEIHKDDLKRVETLERQGIRIDSEISYQQMLLKQLQRSDNGQEAEAAAAKTQAKRRLDELRASLKTSSEELERLEQEVDRAFNPYWGARAGGELRLRLHVACVQLPGVFPGALLPLAARSHAARARLEFSSLLHFPSLYPGCELHS
jgi:hypothetical protein